MTRTRTAGAVTACLTAALLAGCTTGTSDASQLAGRSFESTDVTGTSLVDGTVVRLIVGEDGSVSLHAGCNTLVGDATWSDGTLAVPLLASTRMACDEALAAQDRWLTAFLEASPPFDLDGDTLTLGEGDEQITLTDVAAS